MRRKHGAAWVVVQFFAVSVAQHGMLVGLTLPLQPAMAGDAAPIGPLDVSCDMSSHPLVPTQKPGCRTSYGKRESELSLGNGGC